MNKPNWWQRRHDEIIRRWKDNEISLVDGARALCDLGFNPNAAWATLEKYGERPENGKKIARRDRSPS